MRYFVLITVCVLTSWMLNSCSNEELPPDTTSETYQNAVSAFYVSLAAAQTDEARFAFNKMNEVSRAFPEEAAAWANLGVFAMRQGNFELAADRLGLAREAAPENPQILFLSGMMESRRGRISDAIHFYRSATEFNPNDARMAYSLMTELEREDASIHTEEINQILTDLLGSNPENQVLWFEQARIAVRNRSSVELNNALIQLKSHSENWPQEAETQFQLVEELAQEEAFQELTLELAFFRNALEPTPDFQDDLRMVQFPPTEIGFFITEFLWLPQPEPLVAEPDMGITFEAQSPEGFPESVALVKSVTLLEESPPFSVFIADGNLMIDSETALPFPGNTDTILSPAVMAEIDYNYSFRNDIALAGSDGFRLFEQKDDQTFEDVTSSLGLSRSIINQQYNGVWPADVDLDGDLDLILAPVNGKPIALINQTDGTFGVQSLFGNLQNIVDMKWADFDGDGAADALFLTDDGRLFFQQNLRSNQFIPHPGFPEVSEVIAVGLGDLTANGYFDIITLKSNGLLTVFEYDQRRGAWDGKVVAESSAMPSETGKVALFVADIDNNGSLDIIGSGLNETQIWLSDSDRNFSKLETETFGWVSSVFDVDGSERLDFIGVDSSGKPFNRMNTGTKPYNAYSIRARASGSEGDQRINSFGIGGEMEVRSGLLYQKQLISSPIVHFGLGLNEEADMLRIIWPNGSIQAEFTELGMGSTIFNEQVLKGSCPWLFTNDGESIHFITDILWRSPLGLRINAQETAGVIQTLDRVRIPGEKLKAVDGIYDVRITAELWETHFFDHVSLVAVDHPEGTQVFIDERFVFPAPDLSSQLTTNPQPLHKVTDENGQDVTEIVSELDENYSAPFRKTSYQGLVHEHFIEIDLGNQPPVDKPLWLIAHGWLRPTDSSINLALSQGEHEPPSGLHIKVADGNGGWKTLHQNYGFPAGKLKSILLELDDVFPDKTDRRLRFYTTSEIYWDALFWAGKLPSAQIKETILPAERMELAYRGYSKWSRADSTSPKLPTYSEISSTTQRWRDLEGFHTRFGDVTELLADIDDRYVIMNAGDEMRLGFRSPGEPEDGFERTFILVSDGWVKDGDYNTEASRTVLPLPYHGMADYEYSSTGTLTDDPVYKKNRQDWVRYHTRYISPESFRTALIFKND